MTLAAERRGEPVSAGAFLDLLGEGAKRRLDCGRVLAVFAHPDDEIIALGGQLPRLAGIRLLHVTDGVPADLTDARANGFLRREDYAAARKRELLTAVSMAGLGLDALFAFQAMDQTAARRMPELARSLLAIIHAFDISLVVTHAYEGGHPDHDATAFIVHAACALAARHGGGAPEIVECPLYHARGGRTGFIVGNAPEMAEAITAAGALDPAACKAEAARRFSLERMVERYLAVYRGIAAAKHGSHDVRLSA